MQNFCPPRLQLLAAAIGFALLSPFTLHAQQVVADGDAQTPAAGDYTTTAPVDAGSTAGYALYALNQGTITPSGVVNLSTAGLGAAAAHASGDLSTITLTAGTIGTSGNNAAGLSVADGGTISAGRDADGNAIRITTVGSGSHGVTAASSGVVNLEGATLRTEGNFAAGTRVAGDAQVTLTGGSIETLGSQSYGVDVSSGTATLTGTVVRTRQSNALQITGSGGLEADGVVVETLGIGGYGLVAQSGATATFGNGRISTAGSSATGVALGGDVTLHNTEVLTSGDTAAAADVTGRNSHLQMRGGSLTTGGFGATGLRLMDDGKATLADVKITTHGQGSVGIDMNGARNVLALDNVSVVTHGEVSTAIVALKASTASISGSHLETHGRQSVGIDVRHTTVTLANSRVVTHGDGGAHALYVSRDAGHGAQGSIDGARVEAITHGAGAAGVVARLGGVATLRDSLVHTTGSGSTGVLAADRGTIGLTDTHVLTEGVDAWAADVRAGGTFSMQGGSLVSRQHGALNLQNNASLDIGGGALLSGGNGVLLQVDAALANVGLALDGGSHAEGDIVINPDDLGNGVPVTVDVDVRLLAGSRWQGASTAVDALALQGGSQWTLTGDSQLNSLVLDASTLQLSAADGGRFNTLTVAGDFTSTGGVLYFNGALGDDTAPTDRLHVQGDTAGSADVWVGNVGGRGAQTVDGIPLIQVDGASDARFNLAGRAVAGRYEYFLHKGGKADPGDGDWYLRSEMLSAGDQCELDPTAPDCGPVVVVPPEVCDLDPSLPECVSPLPQPEPTPVLRPELGAYLANQAAASGMFGMRLHDRTGGTARGQGEPGPWVRASRSQADYGVAGGQLDVSGNGNILQLGTDLFAFGPEGRAHLGLMAGKGRTDSTVTSRLTGYTARGTVQGRALGMYGSWVHDPARTSGLYLDGWVQYARFTHTVQGEALAKERYDSRAASASLEAGYTVKMVDGARTTVFVEPQLQVGYTRFSASDHVEANGTVVTDGDAGGLGSRMGVRVFGHAATETGNRVQPFVAVNWLRESHGNSLRLDGERVSGGLPQDRYEAKAGVSLQLAARWTAWADLGLQRGDGEYRDITGQVGLRSTW